MNGKSRILVVDDDPALGMVLEALLRQAGFLTHVVRSGLEALQVIERLAFDAILSDVKMPGMSGLELIHHLSARSCDVPVVLVTAHGTVPLAVEAMKAGAADFLLKPFDREEILFVLRKVLACQAHSAGAIAPMQLNALLGQSPAMNEVRQLIARAARGVATVMIRGESGTGKELVARAVHQSSANADGPFVAIHCAALPEALLESELFGYEKGAFTGAVTTKPGRVELAEGGTLFLDEIGDVSPAVQVKLLRLIQERQFERLGGRQTLRVNVRLVAATHRPLEEMMAHGEFREDLFYRLNVIPLWLPPLRERPGDVALLARRFCEAHGRANGRPDIWIDDDAVAALECEPWPGNVRQLENFIERLVVLADKPGIGLEQLRSERARSVIPLASASAGAEPLNLNERRLQSERLALTSALKQAGNNRTVAARLLGVSRRTLYTKLEEQGLL
jgi:two-component system response regulator AtoC